MFDVLKVINCYALLEPFTCSFINVLNPLTLSEAPQRQQIRPVERLTFRALQIRVKLQLQTKPDKCSQHAANLMPR